MAIKREDTYMGLAPGLNSSGEFVLGQAKFVTNTLSTAPSTILSSAAGTWFHTTAAIADDTTYVLPVPEAGAFYGIVYGGTNSTVNGMIIRTPSSLIDIVVGGTGSDGSTNTAVILETSATLLGEVIGFLGLSATRYAFLNFSNNFSSAYTSDLALAGHSAWSAFDSTG